MEPSATLSEARAAAEALSPLEAYHLVKEAGASDSAALLALLEPEQIRTLVDLDVWRDHELDASDLLLWLQSFREASLDTLARAVRALDPEAVALLLHTRLEIALRPPEEGGEHPAEPIPEWVKSPGEALEPVVETPDGRFWIAARPRDRFTGRTIDEEERKGILSIVDALFRDEAWHDFAGLLRLAHDGLGHGLAEEAYRFRIARLEDLGFPPPERAFEVYSRLDPSCLDDPGHVAIPANDAQLPLAYVAPLDRGLFGAAMNAIRDPQVVRRIEGDLVPFVNSVVVADGVAPADIEAVHSVLSATRGLIDVALAHDTTEEDRLDTACHRLRRQHISVLFRVGYGLTLGLQARARALRDHRVFAGGGDDPLGGLDAASRAVLEALMLRRPRASPALDALVAAADRIGGTMDGARVPGRDAPRPLALPEDVAAADRLLSDLEELAGWLNEAGWMEQVALIDRNVDVLFATAVANVLLGRGRVVSPLTAKDLETLAGGSALGTTREPREPHPESAADPAPVGAAFAGAPRAVRSRVSRATRTLADVLLGGVDRGPLRSVLVHGMRASE